MRIPVVASSVWQRLYKIADEFYRTKPWEWIEDLDIFGVQDPSTGQIGYCSILAGDKDFIGFVVYRGTRGLEACKLMQTADLIHPEDEAILVQDCLQLLFVKREELEDEDRRVMKRIG